MRSEHEIKSRLKALLDEPESTATDFATAELEWVLGAEQGDDVYALLGDGWRDFAKEKPDKDGMYLVYEEAGFNRYSVAKWCYMWSGNTYPVKAWKSLPDPPAFA